MLLLSGLDSTHGQFLHRINLNKKNQKKMMMMMIGKMTMMLKKSQLQLLSQPQQNQEIQFKFKLNPQLKKL